MKKLFLVLLVAVVSSGSTWAQKGMMGVGANVAMNVGTANGGLGFGGGVKFQYNISDYFRIEPSFSYYGGGKNTYNTRVEMAGLVNVHAFFSSPRSLRPYAFAGVGYVGMKDQQELGYFFPFNGIWIYAGSSSKTERGSAFGVDGGIGLDYRVSHHFSLQVEAGIMGAFWEDTYLFIKANIGACYTF